MTKIAGHSPCTCGRPAPRRMAFEFTEDAAQKAYAPTIAGG
jgi:hypothetical protein